MLNENGDPVAASWYVNGVPTIPTAAALLVMRPASGLDETAIFKVALPIPLPFVAESETAYVPDTVGVPLIHPVVALSESPAGKPVAAKLAGALLAELR